MVKLTTFPPRHIIAGLRHTLDFYVSHGHPTVRRWPRKYTGTPVVGVTSKWARFSYINKALSHVSPLIRAMALGDSLPGRWTWKDYLIHFYYKADFLPDWEPPGGVRYYRPWSDRPTVPFFHVTNIQGRLFGYLILLVVFTDVPVKLCLYHFSAPPGHKLKKKMVRGGIVACAEIPRPTSPVTIHGSAGTNYDRPPYYTQFWVEHSDFPPSGYCWVRNSILSRDFATPSRSPPFYYDLITWLGLGPFFPPLEWVQCASATGLAWDWSLGVPPGYPEESAPPPR